MSTHYRSQTRPGPAKTFHSRYYAMSTAIRRIDAQYATTFWRRFILASPSYGDLSSAEQQRGIEGAEVMHRTSRASAENIHEQLPVSQRTSIEMGMKGEFHISDSSPSLSVSFQFWDLEQAISSEKMRNSLTWSLHCAMCHEQSAPS
jgi:hypothetical protein